MFFTYDLYNILFNVPNIPARFTRPFCRRRKLEAQETRSVAQVSEPQSDRARHGTQTDLNPEPARFFLPRAWRCRLACAISLYSPRLASLSSISASCSSWLFCRNRTITSTAPLFCFFLPGCCCQSQANLVVHLCLAAGGRLLGP